MKVLNFPCKKSFVICQRILNQCIKIISQKKQCIKSHVSKGKARHLKSQPDFLKTQFFYLKNGRKLVNISFSLYPCTYLLDVDLVNPVK